MENLRIAWVRLDGQNGHESAYRLLEQLYREATGQPCPPVLKTPRGKPYFADSPLYFSISHTKNHAFCVLAPYNVGIDAEEKDRQINLRLSRKILSPPEKLRYEAARDKRAALLRLWVLKEAAAKLTGEGLQGYPAHTDFFPDDERILEIDGCYVAVLKENDDAV